MDVDREVSSVAPTTSSMDDSPRVPTGRLVRTVTIRLTGDLNRPFRGLATRAIDAQN
jgi:hypothetical protein